MELHRPTPELVTPYPPGIPARARGEGYTIIDYVQVIAKDGFAEEAADQRPLARVTRP